MPFSVCVLPEGGHWHQTVFGFFRSYVKPKLIATGIWKWRRVCEKKSQQCSVLLFFFYSHKKKNNNNNDSLKNYNVIVWYFFAYVNKEVVCRPEKLLRNHTTSQIPWKNPELDSMFEQDLTFFVKYHHHSFI